MSCEKRINIEQKVNFHFKSSLTINASVQKVEYFTVKTLCGQAHSSDKSSFITIVAKNKKMYPDEENLENILESFVLCPSFKFHVTKPGLAAAAAAVLCWV